MSSAVARPSRSPATSTSRRRRRTRTTRATGPARSSAATPSAQRSADCSSSGSPTASTSSSPRRAASPGGITAWAHSAAISACASTMCCSRSRSRSAARRGPSTPRRGGWSVHRITRPSSPSLGHDRRMTKAAAEQERPLNHFDVTGRIRISDPVAVRDAVISILRARFVDLHTAPLHHAFLTFTKLYAGELPGYVGVDTWYHDAQHSLDAALAMARLLDGFQRDTPPGEGFSSRRAVLGIVIALFHDAGYIRRTADTAKNGAEYTLVHVRRSAEFL